MVRNVASVIAELEPEDSYLLSGVEQGMRFSEWVNREKLSKNSGLIAEEVDYRINRCMTRELVERKTIQYVGYKLTIEGYDVLALRTFAQRDIIQGFGAPLGVGKESDVFEAQSFKPLALKLHRKRYTSFREVCRGRDYTSENHRVSWLYTARKAAECEYETFETLPPEVSVPHLVGHNRHAIIIAKSDGVEPAKAKLEFEQVTGVFDLILPEMVDAYMTGYVRASMFEYNAAVGECGTTVSDQSQTVPTDCDNAREFLACDVKSIVGCFRRKYPGKVPDEADVDALSGATAGDKLESINELVV